MIHQVKPNPQLLDQQTFSERLASATSAIGTNRTWRDVRRESGMRGKSDIICGRHVACLRRLSLDDPIALGARLRGVISGSGLPVFSALNIAMRAIMTMLPLRRRRSGIPWRPANACRYARANPAYPWHALGYFENALNARSSRSFTGGLMARIFKLPMF
jgi:hypothetical protein